MNRMCKFVALAFLAILFSSQLTAQESMYERMKGSLDEHSLPLVNKDREGASDGISQKTCQRRFGPWSLQEHKAGI